jgi:hypothetical protein
MRPMDRRAQRHASKHGRNRPETIYFLGFTLYCTRNQKGNFKVGMRTEKTRLRRSLLSLQDLMRRIRHLTIPDQVGDLSAVLRGHYAYYGIAGNIRALQKVYRAVERDPEKPGRPWSAGGSIVRGGRRARQCPRVRDGLPLEVLNVS